jgi:hypothetical protein
MHRFNPIVSIIADGGERLLSWRSIPSVRWGRGRRESMPGVWRKVWPRALSLSPILILQSPVFEMLQTTADRRNLATKNVGLVPPFVLIA